MTAALRLGGGLYPGCLLASRCACTCSPLPSASLCAAGRALPRLTRPSYAVGNEQKVSYAPGWGSLLPHSKLSVDSGLQCPMCTDQRKYMLNASALRAMPVRAHSLSGLCHRRLAASCLTKACCAITAAKTSQLVSSKIVSSTY